MMYDNVAIIPFNGGKLNISLIRSELCCLPETKPSYLISQNKQYTNEIQQIHKSQLSITVTNGNKNIYNLDC